MTEKKIEKVADKTVKKATPKVVAKKSTQEKTVAKKEISKKEQVFAVIATGGKQYIVREGDFLNVEKLVGEHKEGDEVTFKEVLLIDDGVTAKVGAPTVSGTNVIADFVEDARSKKISVIRFRSKSRYFKNKGHRQPYSRVKITKIG